MVVVVVVEGKSVTAAHYFQSSAVNEHGHPPLPFANRRNGPETRQCYLSTLVTALVVIFLPPPVLLLLLCVQHCRFNFSRMPVPADQSLTERAVWSSNWRSAVAGGALLSTNWEICFVRVYRCSIPLGGSKCANRKRPTDSRGVGGLVRRIGDKYCDEVLLSLNCTTLFFTANR